MKSLRKLFSLPSAVALAYFLFRCLFHSAIEGRGLVDGGAISYDTFYPFAFARELFRTHSLLLFQNPFGSLDTHPSLFNLSASILRLLRPFYEDGLFSFDLVFGIAGVTLGSLFLNRCVKDLPARDRLILFFGGGCTFLFAAFHASDRASIILQSGFWGLTGPLDWIATPEILYHAIFFFGVWSVLHKKYAVALSTSIGLWLLHPFTAITFSAFLFLYEVSRGWAEKERVRTRMIAIALIGILGIAVWNFLLPTLSNDSAFFRQAYAQSSEGSDYKAFGFAIPILQYSGFFVVPAIYFILISFYRPKWLIVTELARRDLRIPTFLATALFCIFMTESGVFGVHILQPAHWSRVYPYVFLTSAFAILLNQISPPSRLINRIVLSITGVLAVGDSVVALMMISMLLLNGARPPAILTSDLADAIDSLAKQTSGSFAYFRSCESHATPGDVEYAVMSLTDLKADFAHDYFSPHADALSELYKICGLFLPALQSHGKDFNLLDASLFGKTEPPPGYTVLFHGSQYVLLKKN